MPSVFRHFGTSTLIFEKEMELGEGFEVTAGFVIYQAMVVIMKNSIGVGKLQF